MTNITPSKKPTIREKIEQIINESHCKFCDGKGIDGECPDDKEEAVNELLALLSPQTGEGEELPRPKKHKLVPKSFIKLAEKINNSPSEEMEKEFRRKFVHEIKTSDGDEGELAIGLVHSPEDILAFLRKHLSMQREAFLGMIGEDEAFDQNDCPHGNPSSEEYDPECGCTCGDKEFYRNQLKAELRSKLLQKEGKV